MPSLGSTKNSFAGSKTSSVPPPSAAREALEALGGLELGEPIDRGNLTIFPLLGVNQHGPAYLTLDEAYRLKKVKITETSEGGVVPELRVYNYADVPLLLLDGEELIGAKQNRVLNLTVLVPAKTDMPIPVSCVEQGRWSYLRPDFVSSGRAMFARARARKSEHVSFNLRTRRTRASDQSDVWASIAAMQERMAVHSPTGAMADSYEEMKGKLDDLEAGVTALPGQRGAVFAIGGRVAGMELVDKAETWAKLISKIVRSYALSAVERDAHPAKVETATDGAARGSAAAFLERVRSASLEGYGAIGLGTDVRLEAEALTGAALVAEGACIHLAAFATAAED